MERDVEMPGTWERLCVGLGALAGLGAVAMAAAASHALTARLGAGELAGVRSAVQMQGWHALALIFCGLWIPRGGILALAAAGCFAAGLVLFCAGVYGPALLGLHLPMIAPLGGTILMLGWALLTASALIRRR
jgi:uncharacterized membrane protein YgdD (TMEM256/DUF423 family)